MLRRPLKSKRPARQEISDGTTFVAPIGGWNTRDPLASMRPEYALQLDNWWPTPANVQPRKGASDFVTGFSNTVKSLIPYANLNGTHKLFAATDTGIFDASTAGTVGAAASVITDGRCQYSSMATTGGNFVFVVNGVDDLRYYNGTVWTTAASYAINGGGTLTTSNIVNLNVFKRSLFFLERASMSFYYFPIDTIAGNVSKFHLGALFRKGGYLVSMGTWTIDGGAGVDDYAVFVTSEGQAAVYKGTDPSSAASWALQGVYDLAPPLGFKCFQKFGGDLLYLSRAGLFPLGKALQSSTINRVTAVSDRIAPTFTDAARRLGSNYGWQVVNHLSADMLLVNVPTAQFTGAQQYVMNTISGAWARFTDWDATAFEVVDNTLYMALGQKVCRAFLGTSDFGNNIGCYAKSAWQRFGSRLRMKQINLVRPILTINGTTSVSVAVDTDFNSSTAYGPAVFNTQAGSLWGSALWGPATGAGVWSGLATTKLDWLTVSVSPGYYAAVRLRVLAKDATVEWSATDVVFESGAIQG